MGNGNRGTEKAASAECNVGLGLRMQSTESFTHHHYSSSSQSMEVVGFGSDGGSSGGGPIYCSLSNNQFPCLTDTCDVFGSGSSWPRTSPSYSASKSSGGNMAATAKVTFTESQWQELERQTMIYKYMMASLPVPPQLLIPISKSPSPLPSPSQSTMSGLSRSSDPEPWRCRRTDGKKWRCSRDAAPNQKYCERHAHKSKPRSRKPVESSSHHTATATAVANCFNTQITSNNLNTHPLFNLPSNASPQKPIFHIPTMVSGPTYAQPRCTEWLMKGDGMPGSALNQPWQQQQLMQSSPREEMKRYSNDENCRNWSVFEQHYGEQQESVNTNSYFDMDNVQTQTTRRFIDAWSSGEREEMDELSNKYSVASKGKLPLSSGLSLSMSGDNGIDEDSRNAQLGLGILDQENESGGGLKSQWLDGVSWMGSSPGGPLGEALCLGITSTSKEACNVPSPHCYSTTTTTTTTSGCSKNSCDDTGHGLHSR